MLQSLLCAAAKKGPLVAPDKAVLSLNLRVAQPFFESTQGPHVIYLHQPPRCTRRRK